jgi:hypothetical protein
MKYQHRMKWWGMTRTITRPYRIAVHYYSRIKRLVRWIPVIWQDADWDWVYIISLLEFKISQVRKTIKGSFIGSEKAERRLWEFEQILKRIAKDDYYMNSEQIEPRITDTEAHAKEQFEQDIDFVARYLKKYLRTWWD